MSNRKAAKGFRGIEKGSIGTYTSTTRECTGCGYVMESEEVWWDSTASVAGWSTDNQGNYKGGGIHDTGEVLCEYCYLSRHEAVPESGSWDFSDSDEIEDPWAMDEDNPWYYPG